MELKRLPEKEIKIAFDKAHSKAALEKKVMITEGKRAVAQTQRDYDQKQYDELAEELEYLYKTYEVATEVLEMELAREIFREIEQSKRTTDSYQEDGSVFTRAGDIVLTKKRWQALKQKWGVK